MGGSRTGVVRKRDLQVALREVAGVLRPLEDAGLVGIGASSNTKLGHDAAVRARQQRLHGHPVDRVLSRIDVQVAAVVGERVPGCADRHRLVVDAVRRVIDVRRVVGVGLIVAGGEERNRDVPGSQLRREGLSLAVGCRWVGERLIAGVARLGREYRNSTRTLAPEPELAARLAGRAPPRSCSWRTASRLGERDQSTSALPTSHR